MSEAGASVSVGAPGLLNAARRVVPIVVFGIVPIVAVCFLLANSLGLGSRLAFWDFHALWNAGHDVLHGRSPYPPATRGALAGQQAFVYPAPAAVAAAPFALLPFTASSVAFELLSIGALLAGLWIVGVRDWRCFGLAFLTRPVLHGLTLGAVSPLLTLGLAVTWRHRDRRWIAGAAVAALIVLKVFLWPMIVWLALTRRLAATATALAIAAVTTAAAWAAIGFDGFRAYPHLLDLLSRVLEGKSYSLVALGLSAGTGATAARALAAIVGAACIGLIAWRGRTSDADPWTFTLAVGAALALSPIVWLHYFTLLLVPIAIVSPGLGPLWLLPLAFWVIGGQSIDPVIWGGNSPPTATLTGPAVGSAWVIAYGIAVAAIVIVAAVFRSTWSGSATRLSRSERPVRRHAPA
jgi:hypothetical protein